MDTTKIIPLDRQGIHNKDNNARQTKDTAKIVALDRQRTQNKDNNDRQTILVS